jgi:NAD(P)-dependent dehydrogenase (short-subunit alcohol dehydrogenase family)
MKKTSNIPEKSQGIIVITGCDSGIGKSLTEILMKRGYTVAISYLEENPFPDQPNIIARKMDLRKPEEVREFSSFVKYLCQSGPKLISVICNAGVALGGPIENIPMALYRETLEINYFGVISIIQSLIPELIRDKGRIIVNGSLAGRIAMPFMSPYVSSKFALEGFCDSLRREMNPFGIRTILIEPAAVATPIWNKAKAQDISFVDKIYMDSLYDFRDKFIEGGNQGMESAVAALKIADILLKKKPKARYVIAKNMLTTRILLVLPSFILDKAIARIYKMNYCGDKQY